MMIPYGRQDISQEDIDAVVAVLRSDFLTQGPAVPAFEASVKEATGAAFAVAVSSATAGLHIACLALGLGAGDILWTSPNTFVASSNAGLYCRASVDFVDTDPRTYCMSVAALEEKLASAERDGKLPKIVMPVHFAGQCCDMRAIHALSRRYGFRIIEDASHSIGASYLGQPVGDCRYSDICVFSFHPVKIVTTAEGGLCTAADPELGARLAQLRTHGVTRDPARMAWESEGPWYYQQTMLGLNYRMTDLQAALGASQMKRLGEFVAARHRLARRYDELLAGLPVVTPWQDPDSHSALHLYPVRIRRETGLPDRRTVFERMRAAGIGVNVHYIPVHLQPYYRDLGFRPGQFPEAEAYYAEAISIPLYATLTEEQQDKVAHALRSALLPPASA
jgi:UDP-4-amino-4,6-dideoxy-N-acetyl-beta-L-altrosamine transaminase